MFSLGGVRLRPGTMLCGKSFTVLWKKKKKRNTKRRFLKAGTCPTASLRPAAAACFGDWSTKLVERGVPVLPPHAGSTHGTLSCAPQAILSQLWEFWGASPPRNPPSFAWGGYGNRWDTGTAVPPLLRSPFAVPRGLGSAPGLSLSLEVPVPPPRPTQPGFPLFIADCN